MNSLAKQQKQSCENGSPPVKRQRLLGVNKNNEVIIVEDQQTRPLTALHSENPLSSSHDERIKSFYGSVDVSCSQPVALSNGNDIITTTTQSKTASTQQHRQPCNNRADSAPEIICIDDDEDDDDAVLIMSDSTTASVCGSQPPIFAHSTGTSAASVNVVEHISSAATVNSSTCARPSSDSNCIRQNDAVSDQQHPSSSSVQQADLLFADDGDWKAPAAEAESPSVSKHQSPLSRKVSRLEILLEVGVGVFSSSDSLKC